jgi:aminoglycoside phosphotransferase (APT) family kinase protein
VPSPALAWVADQVGPVRVEGRLTGGMTSQLLALRDDTGRGLVLRLVTEEPWRTHGAALTARERATQLRLTGTAVPAPLSVALDADGTACGHPAHLMTLLPGAVDLDRTDAGSLDRLAATLAAIHAVPLDEDVRTYQSWAWEAKYVVPAWASEPAAWEVAFALLRTAPPAYEPTFLHRDYSPRNVLWAGDEVSGVVDWVETSAGPAWLDVAHCATNLAIRHGEDVAQTFVAAYAERTTRAPQSYYEVMDVVGFLPPPGRAGFPFDPAEHRRLEQRLVAALDRA